MQASTMAYYRYRPATLMSALLAVLVAVLVAGLVAVPGAAQEPLASEAQDQTTGPLSGPLPGQAQNTIAADLLAEHFPRAGETLMVALRFVPEEGWHGYWANPGDAGKGMTLDWQLPDGWEAGEPLYPVPERKELIGLINHVYTSDYAVLVPLSVPADASSEAAPVRVTAEWLSCSDSLCINERARLDLRYASASDTAWQDRFDTWRAAIPALLDSTGTFALTPDRLRLAIPLPAAVNLSAPHLFIEQQDVIDYANVQTYYRDGDQLLIEIPRGGLQADVTAIDGLLAFDDSGRGVRFSAALGDVPDTGGFAMLSDPAQTPLLVLLGGALLGGLLLNLMPCVFPVLSLKALSLARAGGSEAQARSEGLAYTAGVVLACLALGALMLALRAAGQQVGWAFQLQQPLVVGALLVVAILITANLAGLFELPGIAITRKGEPLSAFATGLLAAIVATPCTGPFMAAALGAALLLPTSQALLLFATLGLGLALPFLLLGFIPPLRNALPKPGAWMETFRKILSVPMGLTALALVWLAWRLGGVSFAFAASALGILLVVAMIGFARNYRGVGAVAGLLAIYFVFSLPFRIDAPGKAGASVLEPAAYSEAALNEARASGQPVFVWFTADWCITCKVSEGVAIEREATREALEAAGVVAIRGDWTQPDPAIARFLEERGVAGIPLYLWYPANGGEPEQLPQVLGPDAIIDRAQGSGG